MKYEALDPIDRGEAERRLSSKDPASIAAALLRSALHDPDGLWVQEQALRLATHPSLDVRRAVAISFGHLARLHRTIDGARALPVLRELATDPALAGYVSDALDDIATFTDVRVTAA